MSGMGYHIQLRLEDSRVIADTTTKRRMLARVVLEQARKTDLLAFGLADNHLHIESARVDRRDANELARRIELSLHYRLDLEASFLPVHLIPLEDAKHQYNCFKYILNQDQHHGVHADPMFEATNLPDLLGLRQIGEFTRETVTRVLPRINRTLLLRILGVNKLAPADGPLDRLIDAALAAAALPSLRGSASEVVETRRAIIAIVGNRLQTTDLAAMLHVDRRTVHRLRSGTVNVKLARSIQLQLALLDAKALDDVKDVPPERQVNEQSS